MNAAHLHLLVNHLPVIGEIFSVLLMIYGFIRKNLEVQRAGLWAILITGITGFVSDKTGGPAARMIHDMHLVNDAAIKVHAQAADYALMFSIISGVLALIALILYRGVPPKAAGKPARIFLVGAFIVALFNVSVLVRTSELGGEIRHTEMDATPGATVEQPGAPPTAAPGGAPQSTPAQGK